MAEPTMKLSAPSDIRAPRPDPGATNVPGSRPDPQPGNRCRSDIVHDTIR